MEKSKIEEAIEELEVYNEEQRFWANVRDNSEASKEQFLNSIKLQEAIKEMAEAKILEFADKE